MAKFIKQVSGVLTEESTVAVGGAPNAAKVPELDGTGRLDVTMMPTGIGADTSTLVTTEALNAGDFVNVYNNAGAFNIRKADRSNGRPAHGFVLTAVANAASGVVYFEGTNGAVTGQVPGNVFLGTAGAGSAIPATTTGHISQIVGFATSATSINFQYNNPITLA